MKAKALVPALALAAALLAPPLADAGQRDRSNRGRPPAHGYYGRQPGHPGHGYSSRGYGRYGYRSARPYPRSYRYYAPPPLYYGNGYGYGYGGYGYGGYEGYGYGYYPPPPPPRYRPRVGVGIWFGF